MPRRGLLASGCRPRGSGRRSSAGSTWRAWSGAAAPGSQASRL